MKLDRIRWKGEGTYRMLSYYFAVRWNVSGMEEFVDRVLRPFAVPADPDETPSLATPGMPPQYSIVRRWSERSPYRLLYGGVGKEGEEMRRGNGLGDVLAHLIWQLNSQVIRRSGDFLLIHAGSVCSPDGDGVLLPAQPGSGKTTLATGLVQAGFSYLSDEAGAIDPVTRMLHPYQKALTLKRGHALVFPDLCPNGDGSSWLNDIWPVAPENIRPDSVGGPCRVRFIIAPTYRAGAETELTPVTRAEGAMLLLSNGFNVPVYGSRALLLAADVAREAHSYRLVTGDLQSAIAAITKLTSHAP
jgi:hypothetical protein